MDKLVDMFELERYLNEGDVCGKIDDHRAIVGRRR